MSRWLTGTRNAIARAEKGREEGLGISCYHILEQRVLRFLSARAEAFVSLGF
ncbi:MAG: hypothetical protein NTX81_09130 [Candidatus Bathyarchaeota archaeon]|nr:hypothetical protein [Candidatus Bathyarchaeota archaeon]